MDLLLGLIVGTVVLLSIGYPIWKPAPRVMGSSGGPASELAALEERKESTYAAIRELGFDFHTDKLSEADYQLEIERLKAEGPMPSGGKSPPSGSRSSDRVRGWLPPRHRRLWLRKRLEPREQQRCFVRNVAGQQEPKIASVQVVELS